jgi:hypothetical protein
VSQLNNRPGSDVVSCCREKLVAEAGEQFGNTEEGECPPLEDVTIRVVKTQQAEKVEVCTVVNCKLCKLVKRS